MFQRNSILLALITIAAAAQTPAHKDTSFGYDNTPFLPDGKWRVHDVARPLPVVVTPGTESSQDRPGKPPSDAIVLFDGTNFSKWATYVKGQPTEPKWKIENGYAEVDPKVGGIQTREKFGSMQLHIEWQEPVDIQGKSQGRGNSGVLLMNRYEIQVLDSFENRTYSDGGAAAVYGQYPPLVNSSRKPGEWQTYDIFFEAPKSENGSVVKPAFVTVIHNGVLVQYHREILGNTEHAKLAKYGKVGEEEALGLQNHQQIVRYRNIWVRRIASFDPQ
jgi:hypothetical protein